MTKEAVLEAIGSVAPRLAREYGVRESYLFCSLARGEAHPGSDIDLLVVFGSTPRYRQYLGLIDFLESGLGAKVDLVTRAGVRPRVMARIAGELLRAA